MAAEPFLFGKLPAHGDFVWRGLTADARQAWDVWASREIEAATASLGERFGDAHDRGAPCRFVTTPAGDATGWRAGCLAPSIDSAGRRFLLVLGLDGLAPGEAAALGVAICERCEAVLRRVLIEALTADQAVESLAQAAPCAGEIAAAASLAVASEADGVWWRSGEGDVQIGGAPPTGLLARAMGAIVELGGGA